MKQETNYISLYFNWQHFETWVLTKLSKADEGLIIPHYFSVLKTFRVESETPFTCKKKQKKKPTIFYKK